MPTEKSKMLAGELYDPADAELRSDRERSQSLCRDLRLAAPDERAGLVQALLGKPVDVAITPPFFCDYGFNIDVGVNVYFNVNCVLLDVCRITIGDNCMFGPSVHIYTATHPMDADERRAGLESGRPIVIGRDVWIGGAVVICPGVEIGSRSVIGAGSVVTKSIPSGVLAAGNPCRVLRRL